MKSSSIFFATAVAFTLTVVALPASPVDVTSPNGRHVLKVEAGNGQVSYSITSGGQAVISPTPISITIDGVPRPQNPAAAKVSRRKIHETVKPPVPTIAIRSVTESAARRSASPNAHARGSGVNGGP